MLDEVAPQRAKGSAVETLLYLKRMPVLGSLPTPELTHLAEVVRERFVSKGTVLLRDGEPTAAAYAVVDGTLHVSRGGRDIGHTRAGGVVGGYTILSRDPRGIGAVAETDAMVLELGADALHEIFEEHFGILHHVLRHVCSRLIDTLLKHPIVWTVVPSSTTAAPDGELDLVQRIFFIRQSAPFRRASINALAELSRGFSEARYEAGATLWKAGEPSGWVALLVSGQATFTTTTGTVLPAGPGTPLGALESNAERPRFYDLVADTPLVVLHGQVQTLVDVFEDNTDMAMDYMAVMARWLMDGLERASQGEAALARIHGCDAPGEDPHGHTHA